MIELITAEKEERIMQQRCACACDFSSSWPYFFLKNVVVAGGAMMLISVLAVGCCEAGESPCVIVLMVETVWLFD